MNSGNILIQDNPERNQYMRTCRKCEVLKSDDDFNTYIVKGKSYRRWTCKICFIEYHNKWEQNNQIRLKEWRKENYQKNRESEILQSSVWNEINRDRKKVTHKVWYNNLRHEAFMAYGGYQCNCCGEQERSMLCLDHVNDDGYKDRMTLGFSRKGPGSLYRQAKKEGFPKGKFQVLCANCNQSKMVNKGICSHKLKRATTISKESTLQVNNGSGSAHHPYEFLGMMI